MGVMLHLVYNGQHLKRISSSRSPGFCCSSVTVWSLGTWRFYHNLEFCALLENPEGEYSSICSWFQAQQHLSFKAGQLSRTVVTNLFQATNQFNVLPYFHKPTSMGLQWASIFSFTPVSLNLEGKVYLHLIIIIFLKLF